MKTIKTMKKRLGLKKTVLRSVAVIISFVLISITVSAHEFWKKLLTHSSFNEIASAMVKNTDDNSNKISSENVNMYFEKVNEPLLELEPWMLSENYFGINDVN